MLAPALGLRRPKWDRRQAADEIKHQEQPRLTARPQNILREQQEQGRRQCVRHPVDRIGDQQAAERRVGAQQRPAFAKTASCRGRYGLRLRHQDKQRHTRQRQQDEIAPEQRLKGGFLRRAAVARRQDRRQGRGEHDADHGQAFAPRRHAVAAVVIGAQLRAPGQMRDLQHRPAEIDGEQPAQQITSTRVFGRKEQRIACGQHDGQCRRKPGLTPAPARARAVGQKADRRVDADIPKPRDQQHGADRRER